MKSAMLSLMRSDCVSKVNLVAKQIDRWFEISFYTNDAQNKICCSRIEFFESIRNEQLTHEDSNFFCLATKFFTGSTSDSVRVKISKKSVMVLYACLLILIAIFLPPVAVFLKEEGCTTQVWINIILCLLAYLPGIIHALYIISI
ncbi:hypothetical protein GJ496_011810 [Pomphorhynchus laevis]|nr:hypothetical protein GJ496_011810 [Pomphorhynchus laevis]